MSPSKKSDRSKGGGYIRDFPSASESSDYHSSESVGAFDAPLREGSEPYTPNKREDFILPSPSSPFVSVRKRKRDMPRQQSPRRRRHDSGDTSIATPKSSSHVLSAAYGTSISSGPRRRAATPKLKAADPSELGSPASIPLSALKSTGPSQFSRRPMAQASPQWNKLSARMAKLTESQRSSPVLPQRTYYISDSEDDDQEHKNHGGHSGGNTTDSVSDAERYDVFDTPPLSRENTTSLSRSTIPSNTTSMTSVGSHDSVSKPFSIPPPASVANQRDALYSTFQKIAMKSPGSASDSSGAESPPSTPFSRSPGGPYRTTESPTKRGARPALGSPYSLSSASLASSTRKFLTPTTRRNNVRVESPRTPGPSRKSHTPPQTTTDSDNGPQHHSSQRISSLSRARQEYNPRPVVNNALANRDDPSVPLYPDLQAILPPTIGPSPVQQNSASSSPPMNVDVNPDTEAFLRLNLGTLLPVHIISHNQEAVKKFDELEIPHGIQWQLARGERKGFWTWDDVCQKVGNFAGRTLEDVGPSVATVMGVKVNSVPTDPRVWPELAREQEAMMENLGRGLGLMGEFNGVQNWYGGRVQQLAKLTMKEDGRLKLDLEAMEIKRSHRFARFLGSRRIIQVRIPTKLIQSHPKEVRRFFAQKFVLVGRVFVPFHVKDGSVYMEEIDENYEREAHSWCGDDHRLSHTAFMEWHNPMGYNSNQAISKFVTRYALGLSNTIPVIEFCEEHIKFIDDIYGSEWPVGQSGAPAEQIMTDGCGFINLAALTEITRLMGYESAPTALQGRIGGSKGLWIRHPHDESPEPIIWIRKSQKKIHYPNLGDRAHRIFELLGPSKSSTSIALTTQSILNLHHNGVSEKTIVDLFKKGLTDEVSSLLRWDSMPVLYDAVSKAGGVTGGRLARVAAASSRAMGLTGAQWRADEVDDDADRGKDELDEAPTFTGRNQHSGAPLGIHEFACELIQAGFHPLDNWNLQEKLKQIIKNVVNVSVEKYRIPLLDSVAAWVVPDPFATPENPGGLLEEGQIYYRSSQPLKDPKTELAYHVITGEVILGRYPMRLPSDLQKCYAVDIPDYAQYPDVVIVSVRGKTSLPSLLSGGDMDGDIVNVFRDPQLVRDFESKPLTEAPSNLLDANFVKNVVRVQPFCQQAMQKSPSEAQMWYTEFLLADVVSVQKGLYSMFHDNSVSRFGYEHPCTIRLAYIFNYLLDASKTGLRLLDGTFEMDQKAHGSKPQPFGIFRKLQKEGESILCKFLDDFKIATQAGLSGTSTLVPRDKDLTKPYEDAIAFVHSYEACGEQADRLVNSGQAQDGDAAVQVLRRNAALGKDLHDEIRTMQSHIERAKQKFLSAAATGKNAYTVPGTSGTSPSKATPSKRRTGRGVTQSDQTDLMYEAAMIYHSPLPTPVPIYAQASGLQKLMASICYSAETTSHCSFPWAVDFKTLCMIKAEARGIAPITRELDECKSTSSSMIRALAKNASEGSF